MPHPPTRGVQFNTPSGMIVVEFINGSTLMVPARSLQGLATGTDSEIAEVQLLDGSRLWWKQLDVTFEIGMLMSGTFSANSFAPLARQTYLEASVALVTAPGWPEPVIRFLSDNLPGSRTSGWHHDFLTAYQVGCETLVALGQAVETLDGAKPRDKPELPEVLPRPDDVAVAVIYLAAQNGLLTFPKSDHASRLPRLGSGNVEAHRLGNGLWVAHAHPEVASVLRMLGMLEGDQWTAAAETVWWRDSPSEWNIDFTNDLRFLRAVDDACDRIPDRIRTEIDRFSQITEEDIAVHTASPQDAGNLKTVLRSPPKTREQAISTILWIRQFDFDELFYKFWRINNGWLSPDESRRALNIFNDPLAIAVRRRVAARLYPHVHHLAD